MDNHTIVFCNFLITAALCSAFCFYRPTQKTYDGFSFWTAGIFSSAVLYFLVLGAKHFPSSGLLALTTGTLYLVGILLRLDCIFRFLRTDPLPKWTYLSLVPLFFALSWLALFVRSPYPAAIASSLPITTACLFGCLLLASSNAHRAFYSLYRIAAAWQLVPAVVSLIHPVAFAFPGVRTLVLLLSILSEISFGFLMLMLTASRVSQSLSASKELLESKLAELNSRSEDLRLLKGVLHICSDCKKIQNEQGEWQPVEAILQERSTAQFSHTVCPDCIRILYPEFADDLLSRSDS